MNAAEVKNSYLAIFPDWEKTALTKDPFWIQETREKALALFDKSGFPDSTQESWKYSSLDSFYRIPFDLTADKPSREAAVSELKSFGFSLDQGRPHGIRERAFFPNPFPHE